MDNKKQTLYPNSNDINIKDRFEFDIPIIKEKNSCDSVEFKLAPYLGKNGFAAKFVDKIFFTACLTAAACSFLKISPDAFLAKDKSISFENLLFEVITCLEPMFPSSTAKALIGIISLYPIYTSSFDSSSVLSTSINSFVA